MEEEYIEIGKINIDLLKQKYNIKTDRLIITKERIEHINKRHKQDYFLYGKYMLDVISNPDYILEDIENKDTILCLKTIEELNLEVVVKLHTAQKENLSNTVITFWHMRKRSYIQILNKHKKIYQRLDKDE